MSDIGATGRNGYSHNPKLGETLFEGMRKDGNYLNVADKSLELLLAVKAGESGDTTKTSKRDLTTQDLTQPTPKAKSELNSSGKLALLLGQLAALVGDITLSEMESRLATWSAMMETQKAMGEQLSLEFQTAVEEAEQATETYQSALSTLKSSKAALDAANKKLVQAQAKLDGLSPEDAGYTQALAARDQAANESKLATQKAEQAEKNAMDAHSFAKTKVESADKLQTKVQEFGVKNETVKEGESGHLSNVAKLTLLMALFVELLGKNSEESIKNDLELFHALQEGRQKELDKKSREYQEEVRKSEQMSTIMKWIGKIVGALLTIVALVGAAFTGGASLALAVVGVALMVADEICQAASGVSFIQEALKPLMEHVIKPLADVIGKAISKALEAAGVDKKTADMVGAIAGAIVAVVAIVVMVVVVAIVGKGAAAKLAGAMSKFMGDLLKKIVPNMVQEFAKNGAKAVSNAVTKIGLNPKTLLDKQLLANRINSAVVVGEVAHTTTQAAGNVSQGVFVKNASDAMANFSLAQVALEQIQKWLTQAVEHFSENQKVTEELIKTMSDSLQQNSEAGRFVLRQSRA